MTTADWALVISILSAAISLASFVWNIWSKFIYPKPRVRVQFSMVTILGDRHGGADDIEVLTLSATNHGPIDVTLTNALIVWRKYLFSPAGFGLLSVLPVAPMTNDVEEEFTLRGAHAGAGFPKTLVVGERYTVYLIPAHEALARGDYHDIGFSDSFNRNHWAPRRNIFETLPYIRDACEKGGKDWRARLH
jgi:hypothetical protein